MTQDQLPVTPAASEARRAPARPTASPIAAAVRRLRAIFVVDLRSLDETLPQGRVIAAVAIAAIVVVFGVVRLGIRDVYTESLPFLLLAMVIGYLSRATGIGLVLAFGLVDLVMSLVSPTPYTDWSYDPLFLLGRLISWWVLWLLVVSIPTLQRVLRARLGDDARQPQPLRQAAIAVSALVAGILTFLWSNAEPYLIRPVFGGSPQSPAMLPQQMPVQLGVAAGVIALVLGYAYQARAKSPTDFISLVDLGSLRGASALVARVVVYALALVAILGLLTSPIDPIILIAAFVGAELLAGVVSTTGALRNLIASTPLWARLLAGMAATFLVAQLITGIVQQPLLGSEFFPMIVSMAVGLVIFRVLVTAELAPVAVQAPPRPSPGSGAAVVALLAVVAAATALLASPTPAAADNCSGLSDCLSGWWAQMGAAVSAIAAFLWSLITAAFEKTPPIISDLEPLASEEGAAAEYGAIQMLQNRVAVDVLNETGDTDEYYRIKGLTPAEFAQEAMTGKWDGYGARSRMLTGGSIGASAG
ncbi:MAG TPA: hypothetical protein VFK93_02420 [Candidatus Limnocylindria bacterium]|nr:hypothetical protein [Candidatus Limnocylindria bacterium]